MLWEFAGYVGQIAVIDGEWKAVQQGTNRRSREPDPWELYDLSTDPGETDDLSATHPDVLERLVTFWKAHRTAGINDPLTAYDGEEKELP